MAVKLGVSDLKQAQHVRNLFSIIVEAGVTPEDLQNPGFWANVARSLHVRDKIEVWADDQTWYCECVVRSVGNLEAVVSVVRGSFTEFGGRALAETKSSNYRVRNAGMKRQWSVFRLVDGKDKDGKPAKVEDGPAIKEGFGTREQAEAWAAEHAKAMAA